MSTERPRRAVVTGIGVIAPNGLRADAYWKSVREGLGVLDRITRAGCEDLPLKVAGEVRGFDPSDLIEEPFLVQTDRFSHYAMAAAQLALDDAGLVHDGPEEPFSIGVVTAAGSGGGEFGQRELQKLWG
ncbi:beta-ketoacyl synthase N-terminal-like domain-containing protein, partial [Streptomyces hydrogenans]